MTSHKIITNSNERTINDKLIRSPSFGFFIADFPRLNSSGNPLK